MDRVERIIIPIAIALIILLLYTQIFVIPANRRLQVQIDTVKRESILRDSALSERMEYLADPAVIQKRTMDLIFDRGMGE